MGLVAHTAVGTTGVQRKALVVRRVDSDGAVLIFGGDTQFRIQRLKPGCVLLTARGGGGPSDANGQAELAMLRELDVEMQRSGELTVFADLRESTRMAAESRELAARWMRQHRDKFTASHVLVRSKLLEMAMSIIGMVVGRGIVRVYSQPKAFLAAMGEAAPTPMELPTLLPSIVIGSRRERAS